MKIGIDASRAFVKDRTGTENYSYQLICAMLVLDKKNDYVLYHRNIVLSAPSDEIFFRRQSTFSSLNVPTPQKIHQPSRKPSLETKIISFPRLWTQIGLAREVLINPPDVLFVPAHTLPVIRRPGLKTVVTIHDLGYEYLPQYHKFPHKLYLNKSTEYAVKHATHLIAVSQATENDLINKMGCPKDKITVIYEGFDEKKFKPDSNRHSGKSRSAGRIQNLPYILFVGTLQPRKNIERLIEAFSLIKTDIQLVIAGNKGWLYDDILSAPKRFGVEKRVKFLGYTKEEDLPTLYQNALCFCLPSLFEGFGLPVLEAMACGCPVIVSNSSSLPEVAGEAGIYVNPLNVNDIAEKLKLIIENGKLRMEISKKSLIQAKKFSWEKCARETIKVLESVGKSD